MKGSIELFDVRIHRSFWLGPLIIGGILALLALLFSRGRLIDSIGKNSWSPGASGCFSPWLGSLSRRLWSVDHARHSLQHRPISQREHAWAAYPSHGLGHPSSVTGGLFLADGDRHRRTGRSHWLGRLTSMLYGVAAALILDEFALWLNLRMCTGSARAARATKRWLCLVVFLPLDYLAPVSLSGLVLDFFSRRHAAAGKT